MYKNILIEKFEKIKEIPFLVENKNCGLMLEDLLETSGGEFNIPDFYDIEIKATQYHEKKEITLFSHPPYGNHVFPMQYISGKYGYPDHDYKNINILKGIVKAKRKTRIGLFYYYKLDINDVEKRIYLNIYNSHFQLVESNIYWDYDELKDMLERKLKNLAIFIAEKKKINDNYYYIYKELTFYRLKGFEAFISELKNGNVYITINTGVYKTGYRIGQFVDHGCAFKIKLVDIEKLFTKQ